MELFIDLFSKVQYGIALIAVGLLLGHSVLPNLIRFREAVKSKSMVIGKSVAEVASSSGPSIQAGPPVSRKLTPLSEKLPFLT